MVVRDQTNCQLGLDTSFGNVLTTSQSVLDVIFNSRNCEALHDGKLIGIHALRGLLARNRHCMQQLGLRDKLGIRGEKLQRRSACYLGFRCHRRFGHESWSPLSLGIGIC